MSPKTKPLVTMADIRSQHSFVKSAQSTLDSLVKNYFFGGREVEYTRSLRRIRVTVVDTNFFGDVKVRGKNGKEYWLHYYRFLEAGNP